MSDKGAAVDEVEKHEATAGSASLPSTFPDLVSAPAPKDFRL